MSWERNTPAGNWAPIAIFQLLVDSSQTLVVFLTSSIVKICSGRAVGVRFIALLENHNRDSDLPRYGHPGARCPRNKKLEYQGRVLRLFLVRCIYEGPGGVPWVLS